MARVNVILLGVYRLDTGLHELELEGEKVKDLYPQLVEKAHELNPESPIKRGDLDGCIVLINGKQSRKGSKLADGDTVYLMPPVCGG